MNNQTIKENLALAYQIFYLMGYSELTYSHLSARAEDGKSFFILPFGLLFNEVTVSNLLRVDFNGHIIEGEEYQYNQTGYIIHGSIYKARSDLNAIFHTHTPETIAVSVLKEGLRPLSQWALHFYDRVAYHDYNSLSLSMEEQGDPLVRDLGDKKIIFLRNHGVLTSGSTLWEAYFYFHHLQHACKTQCLAMAMGKDLIEPSPEICKKSVNDLLNFEKDIGRRDWEALSRLIKHSKL